jgi:hypothetical protein
MERRKALLASPAVAVTMVTRAFAYSATNLINGPSDDKVGELTAAQSAPQSERPVQIVFDEVPGSPPPGWVPADSAATTTAATEGITPATLPPPASTVGVVSPSTSEHKSSHDDHWDEDDSDEDSDDEREDDKRGDDEEHEEIEDD